jgi:hypothetical protein
MPPHGLSPRSTLAGHRRAQGAEGKTWEQLRLDVGFDGRSRGRRSARSEAEEDREGAA